MIENPTPCQDLHVNAPNPHDIGEAVATRTVVGAAFGSDKANEDVAPVQAKVVEALGLSHLEKIA